MRRSKNKKIKPRVIKRKGKFWARINSRFIAIGLVFLIIVGLPLTLYLLEKRVELRSLAAGPELFASANGTGDCSQTSPCSLTTAGGKATPGTTIIAAPGNYSGSFSTTKGGTSGNFITYRSQNKHGAIITGHGNSSSMSVVEINQEFIRFQDFTITGPQSRHGFHINANNVEVIGNNIHTLVQWKTGGTGWKGGAGIQTGKPQMSNLLIDGNVIHHIGAPGSTEQLIHGMYIDSHVTNSRVTNNLIYEVEDFGLHPYPEEESSGWHFINNTIVKTGRGILQAPKGVTRNNIVYNTRNDSYVIRGSGNVVSNNISGGTGGVSITGVTSDVDPMFVNPATDGKGDFHLKPGSPAIDKGSKDQAPPNDHDGKTRPIGTGIDIGAFESGDGPKGSGGNGSGPVPSFVCAGSGTGTVCPSNGPSRPLTDTSPNNSLPNSMPSSAVPNNNGNDMQGPNIDPVNNNVDKELPHGDGQGLITLILSFFVKLLELLKSLFN